MILEENIRAILECNFAGYKDEIIDIATKNIMSLSNIENQNSIIEELEKIKAEIHKLAFDDDDGEYIGVIDDDTIMDLIDNRISELKGE